MSASMAGNRDPYMICPAAPGISIEAALWADLRQAGLLHPDAPVPN
jgi:hypothetical protein